MPKDMSAETKRPKVNKKNISEEVKFFTSINLDSVPKPKTDTIKVVAKIKVKKNCKTNNI